MPKFPIVLTLFAAALVVAGLPRALYADSGTFGCGTPIECYQKSIEKLQWARELVSEQQAENERLLEMLKAQQAENERLLKAQQVENERILKAQQAKNEHIVIENQRLTLENQRLALENQQILTEHRAAISSIQPKTDAISVSSDGKVGIGTLSPNRKLQVEGGGQISLLQGNSVANNSQAGLYWHTGNHYAIYRTPGPWTSNTYQQLKLDWDTGIILTPGTGNNTGYDKSYVEITGGKGLRVTQGSVGIGTTSPEYKLDVSGTIRGNNVSPSDKRHKQNIQPLENALAKLQGLRGVSFDWKDKAQEAGTQIGLIAQEVEQVLPELVSTDSEGYKSIAYGKLTAVLIEAIKEQQRLIEQIQRQL